MKLTEEEVLNLHVEMWNEMTENGYRFKNQSFVVIKHTPKHECFFCEYYRQTKEDGSCLDCPFIKFASCEDINEFDEDDRPCIHISRSPYAKFTDIHEYGDLVEIKNLCIEIAELGLIWNEQIQ